MTHSLASNLFFALLICFFACSDAPKNESPAASTPAAAAAQTARIKGLYQSDGERHILRDCDSGKTFWVENTKDLDSLREQNLIQPSYEMEPVVVHLTGKLLAPSADAASFDGKFTVEKIDSVETLNFMNCCETWDFWLGGTEPFWDCQVFPEGGFIIFREAGGERVYRFDGVKPVVAGKTTTYVSQNSADEKIKIVIKQEPASDGMSDMKYNHSCKLEVAGQKFEGIARKYGETISE